MSTKRVTFIIVTYHSRPTIDPLFRALQPVHEAGIAECIVVDNSETEFRLGKQGAPGGDDTAPYIRAHYPWATVIESGGNIGYGRACNLGLAHAKTPYAALMNSDVAIGLEALRRLLDFLDAHPRAAMVAPALVQDDGELQAAGGLPSPGRILLDALGLGHFRPYDRPIEPGSPPFQTNWLCGALLVARRDTLNRLGGFDSRFFLYFEETDLCKRVLESGGQLWALGEAVAHHANNYSANATRKRLFEGCIAEFYFPSRLYYLVKHFGWTRAVTAELGELAGLAARDVTHLFRPRSQSLLAARLRGPVLRLPGKGA